MPRKLQLSLSRGERAATGVLLAVGILAERTGRLIGYVIALSIIMAVLVGTHGVMRRKLQDAIEFGAEGGAQWERMKAGRHGGATVHDLSTRRGTRRPTVR